MSEHKVLPPWLEASMGAELMQKDGAKELVDVAEKAFDAEATEIAASLHANVQKVRSKLRIMLQVQFYSMFPEVPKKPLKRRPYIMHIERKLPTIVRDAVANLFRLQNHLAEKIPGDIFFIPDDSEYGPGRNWIPKNFSQIKLSDLSLKDAEMLEAIGGIDIEEHPELADEFYRGYLEQIDHSLAHENDMSDD